jgi:hypothetical protein
MAVGDLSTSPDAGGCAARRCRRGCRADDGRSWRASSPRRATARYAQPCCRSRPRAGKGLAPRGSRPPRGPRARRWRTRECARSSCRWCAAPRRRSQRAPRWWHRADSSCRPARRILGDSWWGGRWRSCGYYNLSASQHQALMLFLKTKVFACRRGSLMRSPAGVRPAARRDRQGAAHGRARPRPAVRARRGAARPSRTEFLRTVKEGTSHHGSQVSTLQDHVCRTASFQLAHGS